MSRGPRGQGLGLKVRIFIFKNQMGVLGSSKREALLGSVNVESAQLTASGGISRRRLSQAVWSVRAKASEVFSPTGTQHWGNRGPEGTALWPRPAAARGSAPSPELRSCAFFSQCGECDHEEVESCHTERLVRP